MRDLDELLTGGVAGAAADAVDSAPNLAALRTRGVRRRRFRRTALAGIAATVLVVAIGPTADRFSSPDPAPSPPSPSPSPSPSPDKADPNVPLSELTPEQIVDHPKAVLINASVSPTAPDVRATIWSVCDDDRCTREVTATAVTSDAFETRTVLSGGRYSELKPLGSRGFLFTKDHLGQLPRLLAPDGTVSAIEVEDGPARPLAEGEVPWGVSGSGVLWAKWLGIDPATGTAHEFPVPADVDLLQLQPNGRLEVTTAGGRSGTGAFHWSENGGASWQSHTLPENTSVIYGLVPSAQPSTMALIEVADGATGLAFGAMHVSRDGGDTWQRISEDEDPAAYAASIVVLPDGALLAHLESWSDDGVDKPADRSHGFYVGADWRDLRPVDMGAPFTADEAPHGPHVLDVQVGSETVTMYAASDRHRVFRTTDNGVTWEEVQTR